MDEIALTPGYVDLTLPPILHVEGPGYLTLSASNDRTRKRWRRVGRYYISQYGRFGGPRGLGYITERYVRWRFTPRKRRPSTPSASSS